MAIPGERRLPPEEFGYGWPELAHSLEQLRNGVLTLGAEAAQLSPLVEQIRRQTTALHAHLQVVQAASAAAAPLRLVREQRQPTARIGDLGVPAPEASERESRGREAGADKWRSATGALALGATLTLLLHRRSH